MKKLVILFTVLAVLAIACCPKANAQTSYVVPEKKVVVNASDLTSDQLFKIESEAKLAELNKKLQTYGNWVGVGGEIGTAVKEGLNAVVDVADKFSNTNVGKFTLTLVAWKIIGKDIARICLGLIFFILMTWIFVKIYKNTYSIRRVLVKNPGFLKYPKEYQVIEPKRWEGYEAVKILMIFLYAGAIGLTYAIMFAA
jgi:hypothetical protein